MANDNFTPSVHAFTYCYANVLMFSNVRNAYKQGKLVFGPGCVTLKDDPEWISKKVPTRWLKENSSRLETFWGFVESFCREILLNPAFYLVQGGPESSGGFGLYARKAIDHLALQEALIGYVEPLTPEDLMFMESQNFQSFIQIDKTNTTMLYGVLSLLNNARPV